MASFRPNSGGALAASKQGARKSPLAAAGLASVGSGSALAPSSPPGPSSGSAGNSSSSRSAAVATATAAGASASASASGGWSGNGKAVGQLLGKEQETLTQGESGVATDKGTISNLERKLKDELRPEVAKAKDEASKNEQAQERLRQSLSGLGEARLQASQQVGDLSKRELAEIKRLAKNPPKVVRQTLAACWLLLSTAQFRAKPASAVKFDDAKDWAKIQKLLATDSFIPEIMTFDTAALAIQPEVARHVASAYLGLEVGVTSLQGKSPAPTKGSSAPEAPLTLDVVKRSSLTCAALFSWMLELMREFFERMRLEAQLKELQGEEEALRERVHSAEQAVVKAEAELSALKEAAARREAELQTLRAEEATAKRAVRDLDKLEQLMHGGPDALLESRKRSDAPTAPQEEKEEKEEKAEEWPVQRPKPRRSAPAPKALEVEYCGSLAHVDHDLARLYIPFDTGESALLEGDARQALVLPKVAAFLSDRKSTLKVLLEGRRTREEPEELAAARCLSVFNWLVNVAACRPSSLRMAGVSRSLSSEAGVACVAIHELRVAADDEEAVPVHFQVGSVSLSNRAKEGLKVAAALIAEDDLTICVEGHCHKSGEDESIAGNRAVVVLEELVLLGVRESQLETRDCKARHPVSRLSGEQNCRVELHVVQ